MNTVRTGALRGILGMLAIAALTAAVLVISITASAAADEPDWKQAPTGLAVSAGNAAGDLDITWDSHPQTSKNLSDYRVTWTPYGEDFKSNDQTDWYAYPTTNQVTVTGLDAGATYQVRVRARYDDGKKSRWSDVITGQAGVTWNAPTESAVTHTYVHYTVLGDPTEHTYPDVRTTFSPGSGVRVAGVLSPLNVINRGRAGRIQSRSARWLRKSGYLDPGDEITGTQSWCNQAEPTQAQTSEGMLHGEVPCPGQQGCGICKRH